MNSCRVLIVLLLVCCSKYKQEAVESHDTTQERSWKENGWDCVK